MAMPISVIIPTLNEERTITATLAHTASLGFDELIVVDGGSTDKTPALLESYRLSTQSSALSPVLWVTAPPGRARQMNEGAKASRGEILSVSPCRHPASRRCQNSDQHGTGRSTDGGRTVRCPIRSPIDVGNHNQQDDELAFETERPRHRRSGSVRASSLFEQMGGFADIPLMEDIEFSRRLKRKGATAALTATVITSFRRWEQQGPLQTILLMWTLRFLYWIGISPSHLVQWYKAVR